MRNTPPSRPDFEPRPTTAPPSSASISHLQPHSPVALAHVLGNLAALSAALLMSRRPEWWSYIAGQSLLALVFVHAFVLLHEAGHHTLFRVRWANRWAGHGFGFVALIPFAAWQRIHARHHHYTGWQDLDATTAALLPRTVQRFERIAINLAWRSWLPLFSILYRLQNYWNLPRIASFLRDHRASRSIRIDIALMLVAYACLIAVVGPRTLLMLIGPALLVSLMIEDVMLLGQHTHMPQQRSEGAAVQAFSPIEQAAFTRSMRLPAAVSLLLMHFDRHELHHMYPRVPGYRLNLIPYRGPNEVECLAWLREAKRLSGVDFLFRNRDDTGAPV